MRRLAAGMLAGFTVAIAAAVSIPVFAAGSLQRVLQAELKQEPGKNPAAINLSYFANEKRPAKAAQLEAAGQFIRSRAAAYIGLPITTAVYYGSLDVLLAQPVDPMQVNPSVARWMNLAFLSDLERHVKLVDGRLPRPGRNAEGHYELLVEEATLDKQDFTVGAVFRIPLNKQEESPFVTGMVTGAFQRLNPWDPYWFMGGGAFDQTFFLDEASWQQEIAPREGVLVHQFSWYFDVPPESIRLPDVTRLLSDLYELEARVAQVIPDTRIFSGPMELLSRYAVRAVRLEQILLLVAVPALTTVGYFLVVTAGLMVDAQRQEIAVLRSRGASLWQVTGLYLLEGLLLAALALAAGYPLGIGLARGVGAAAGFLQFVHRTLPPILVPAAFWWYGALAAALMVVAYLLPALVAARESIVSYKRESARQLRRPFWARWLLDVLCLGLAAYGYYTLWRTQQALVRVAAATAPFRAADATLVEPLHVLAPALFVFGAGLLLLRLLPLLAGLAAAATRRWARAPLYLALIQLSRAPVTFTPVVLLLTLSVGMGLYSAAAARTLERNTADRIAYRYGADVVLHEAWEYDEVAQVYYPPPWEVHLQVPGVLAAARVRTQEVTALIGGQSRGKGLLMAIDPQDFGRVTWSRRDLTYPYHINDFLNVLAADEENVLVTNRFLQDNKLKLGDRLTLSLGGGREVPLVVAGAVNFWPSLYPQGAPFFVANLEYEDLGLYPYQVWLKLAPDARIGPIIDELKAASVEVVRVEDARQALIRARRDPELGGLLGGLTNGFLLASGITVLGFWLFAALSARSRLLQFGVLRAMGLSAGQLLATVALEQVLVVVGGVAAGTGIGLVAARFFVPFLQQGADAASHTPPFVVVMSVADGIRLYTVLLIMLLVGLASLMWALGRLRIHEAVRLGEDG